MSKRACSLVLMIVGIGLIAAARTPPGRRPDAVGTVDGEDGMLLRGIFCHVVLFGPSGPETAVTAAHAHLSLKAPSRGTEH